MTLSRATFPQPLTHFAPKAKRCIYLFMEGGPSQMDLFDHKPKLNELDGQPMPESMLNEIKFAFIQKESARLMGSPRTFRRYGECGMELSDLLPHLSTCVDDIALVRSMHGEQFNHLPGQLMMLSGSSLQGWPTLGSWLNYGLGSESQNLSQLRGAGHLGTRLARRCVELVERIPAIAALGNAIPQSRQPRSQFG